MNRTNKDATVKVFHYEGLQSLKAHMLAFVTAYDFAKHRKALGWKTPLQTICQASTKDPGRFRIDPHHLIPGPYTLMSLGRAAAATSNENMSITTTLTIHPWVNI
jgi:hypothetical protein